MAFESIRDVAFGFLEEHRLLLAALISLGAILFLAEETINSPEQVSKKSSSVRTLRLFGYVALLGVAFNLALYIPLVHEPVNLAGKSYVITGCTPGGIGYETARFLLEWNASHVVCTMRTPEKAEALKAAMVGAGPGKFDVVLMELTSLESVREGAKEIKANYPMLDGVMLNAGLMTPETHVTKDGFDEMFQVNHLSQYLLLRMIEERLLATSRVVFVSSSSFFFLGYLDRHSYGSKPGGRFVINDVVKQWFTYTDTKLMNVLASNAFAKRLAAKGVVVNSVCPGLVGTGFQSRMPDSVSTLITNTLVGIVGRTPDQGAMRGLNIMTSPRLNTTTGLFFDPYISMPLSRQVNEENEQWLWETSAKLLGLSP